MIEMKEGMVAGVIIDRARLKNPEHWKTSLDVAGERACQLLSERPGFEGVLFFWDNDNTGDVIMLGLWDSMDRRMGYEDSIAESVRSLLNPLFEKPPKRTRYNLTHCFPPVRAMPTRPDSVD